MSDLPKSPKEKISKETTEGVFIPCYSSTESPVLSHQEPAFVSFKKVEHQKPTETGKSAPASIFATLKQSHSEPLNRNAAFERLPLPASSSGDKRPVSVLGSILNTPGTPNSPQNLKGYHELNQETSTFGMRQGTTPFSENQSKPRPIPFRHPLHSQDSFDSMFVSPVQIPETTHQSTEYQTQSSSVSEQSVVSPQEEILSSSQFQTLPRMSRPSFLARRTHSTLIKSPAHVLVKRKSSYEPNSSISPVTSESYGSLGQSPAISFLTAMAESSTNIKESPTVYPYCPGDGIGDYLLSKELGVGSFSRVFQAATQNPKEPNVAIKIILRDPSNMVDRHALRKESYLWSRLSHPNLLRMYESFEADDAIFVVTELATGGHLLDHILRNGRPGLPEMEAKLLFKQIASALHYLHVEMAIVHRDVKLENILLDESKKTTKLTDFGLSEPVSEHFWDSYTDLIDGPFESSRQETTGGHVRSYSTQTPAMNTTFQSPRHDVALSTSMNEAPTCAPGSLHYCAPEVLKQAYPARFASDIWSLGCVLHAMLAGCLPFNDSYLPRLQMAIVNGKWDKGRLEMVQVSEEVKQLISGMLQVKIEERYTISEVVMHPWLSS